MKAYSPPGPGLRATTNSPPRMRGSIQYSQDVQRAEQQSGYSKLPSANLGEVSEGSAASVATLQDIQLLIYEEFEAQRLFLGRKIYPIFLFLMSMLVLANFVLILVIFVGSRDSESQIDVIFDMLDDFSNALEMILINTMVPPSSRRSVHGNATSGAEVKGRGIDGRWETGSSNPHFLEDFERALRALRKIKNLTRAYYGKQGKRTTAQTEEKKYSLLKRKIELANVKYKREESAGMQDLPTFEELVKTERAVILETSKMADVSLGLYDKLDEKKDVQEEFSNYIHKYQEQQAAKQDQSDQMSQVDGETIGPLRINPAVLSSAPMVGGIGTSFATFMSEYESRSYCHSEDNLIPIFTAESIGDVNYFNNVSMACAIRHIAYGVDFLNWIIEHD